MLGRVMGRGEGEGRGEGGGELFSESPVRVEGYDYEADNQVREGRGDGEGVGGARTGF